MQVSFAIPRSPNSRVELFFEFKEKISPDVINGFDWYLSGFSSLVDFGGFCYDMSPSKIDFSRRAIDAHTFGIIVLTKNVDPRAFLVLFFGLYSFVLSHNLSVGLVKIRPIDSPYDINIRNILEEVSEPYPEIPAVIEPYIVKNVSVSNKRRVVFQPALINQEKCRKIFESWQIVAALSFPRSYGEFEDGQNFLLNSSIEQEEDGSLSIIIDEFQCHDSAVNPIITSIASELGSRGGIGSISIS